VVASKKGDTTMTQKTSGADPRVAPGGVHEALGRYILADGFECTLDLEKSHGSILHDSRTGSDFLDFFTCFASSPLGFNHPALMDEAYLRHLAVVAAHNPSNSDLYTVEFADFVTTFAELAAPPEMKRFFFIAGGALAVENALKAAFDWKIRLNKKKGLDGELGTRVIHFREAFHGRSGYTLSLTNTLPVKTDLYPKFDWPRVTNPKIVFPLEGQNLSRVEELEKRALAEIREVIESSGDDVAALIIEPIQGEGGDNHFRGEFLRELRKITEENDILYILDEVQTGLGMTGEMWAFQHFGFTPDLIAFGKKTQVCGVMASARLDEPEGVFRVSGRINSTWGGNLVDMVRARRILEVIAEERLVENAADRGRELVDGLVALQERYPEWVSNARGRGLFCAFDLPRGEDRDRLRKLLYENRFLALPCGTRTLRFRPALNVGSEEIARALEILERTLPRLAD
jgi:L-lysine 6-transaminase